MGENFDGGERTFTYQQTYSIVCLFDDGKQQRKCIKIRKFSTETSVFINFRFQDHTSTSTNSVGHYKSAMLQHARENGHHFRKEDVTILSSEQDWEE